MMPPRGNKSLLVGYGKLRKGAKMAPPKHACMQDDRIMALIAQADRVEKEVYVGREGRAPVTVRLDRIERVVNKLTYVSTALLITALVSFGGLLFRMVATYAVNGK